MISIDIRSSYAVLIGSSDFPRDPIKLLPLPNVENNIFELVRILSDPSILGLPESNILVILNGTDNSSILEDVDEITKKIDDTLIFYYSGHGLLGDRSRDLYLATAKTTSDGRELNALSFQQIKIIFKNSPARKKILILDCCYSGKVIGYLGHKESTIISAIDIEGTYAIASTPPNKEALSSDGNRFTLFTGKLIDILSNGIQNNKEYITLEDLYFEIFRDFSKRENVPHPQKISTQEGDKIRFCLNKAFKTQINDKEKVLEIISSKSWENIKIRSMMFSDDMIGVRYKEKYNSTYYHERPDVLNHFDNFIQSDKITMAILGKAGTGKSSLVCNIVKKVNSDTLLWLQDCAHLQINPNDLENYISKTLGLEGNSAINTIQVLVEEDKNRQCIFLFDAVNEFQDREELLKSISQIINKIQNRNIKIIITCRLPVWNIIKRHYSIPASKEFHVSGQNSYVVLDSFSSNEINKVYEKYKIVFELKTDFKNLSNQVVNFITQPLFLKLTAETYKGKEIPKFLALRKVFTNYINRCLTNDFTDGKELDPFDSIEFIVLERIINLMYSSKKREIANQKIYEALQVLNIDITKLETGYLNLLDVGLVSERKENISTVRETVIVFITYERVFEFLLAEICFEELTIEEILKNLDFSIEHSFLQLRGALELKLGFEITDSSHYRIINELVKIDRPDSRQFLCNVIQTIYEGGNTDLASKIIKELSLSNSSESTMLAIQAAYQLKLDDFLISLCFSSNNVARDLATVYLYERWNKARLDGKLDEGYELIYKLKSYVKITSFININPTKSTGVNALKALFSMSLNMALHIIDDPKSVMPLIPIFKDIIKTIPSLYPVPSKDGNIKFKIEAVASVVIQALVLTLGRVLKDEEAVERIFEDKISKRAFLDIGSLITLDNLVDYKEKVIRLITWRHAGVSGSSRSVLTRHVYKTYEIHFPFLVDLIDNENLPLPVRINVLHSLVYGTIARIIKDKNVEADTEDRLIDYLISYWEELIDVDESEIIGYASKEGLHWILQNVLFGIFTVEAILQINNGVVEGSKIIHKIISYPSFKDDVGFSFILGALKKVIYQGYTNYITYTLIEKEFRQEWEFFSYDLGVQLLSELRGLYQDEVDSILVSDERIKPLWFKVKASGKAPEPKEFWELGYKHWIMIGTAVDTTIMKISGLALLDIAFSNSVEVFIDRLVRTLIAIAYEPERINILHYQYAMAHNPVWDYRLDELEIPSNITTLSPEIHEYYKLLSENVVKDFGKGMLYE